MSASKNKFLLLARRGGAWVWKIGRNRGVLAAFIIVLAGTAIYGSHQYKNISKAQTLTSMVDFRNQFFEGKACGLLTNHEATVFMGTAVNTDASVSAADSPAGDSRSGNPRIDSCSYTAEKSSDGYIDLVMKTYGGKNDAAKNYDQQVAKLFTSGPRDAGLIGKKLTYGDGVFYLLKDDQVIELSASYTPRRGAAETEAFARTILDQVIGKL